MAASFKLSARKRPVNLTLNEDLVIQAKSITDNLSSVVESLLAEFVAQKSRDRLLRGEAIQEMTAAWNQFNSEAGSIADEYSSL